MHGGEDGEDDTGHPVRPPRDNDTVRCNARDAGRRLSANNRETFRVGDVVQMGVGEQEQPFTPGTANIIGPREKAINMHTMIAQHLFYLFGSTNITVSQEPLVSRRSNDKQEKTPLKSVNYD